ncbi:MAG: hypothetical protein HXS47_08325 [Theionarchaea archaeon]|nr:hypothetical protein [Theionarchaea archaeon]
MDFTLSNDELIIIGIIIIILFFFYIILREFRMMKTDARKMEVELDREKLRLMQQDMVSQKGYPFTRLSTEQLNYLKELEDENFSLETDIFAREKVVEERLKRLENYVKLGKLEGLLEKIKKEEKKIG